MSPRIPAETPSTPMVMELLTMWPIQTAMDLRNLGRLHSGSRLKIQLTARSCSSKICPDGMQFKNAGKNMKCFRSILFVVFVLVFSIDVANGALVLKIGEPK